MRFTLSLAACVAAAVFVACLPAASAQRGLEHLPAPNATLVSITRNEVMACAKKWAAERIPYCQCNSDCCGHCPYCGSTRCDCSGYVSACWGVKGYTTFTLPSISHRISRDDLQPGDIMLYQAEHVVIFGGWADSSKTHYHCWQEAGCHVNGPHYAFESVVPYPMNWNPQDFLPYRYNHIVG